MAAVMICRNIKEEENERECIVYGEENPLGRPPKEPILFESKEACIEYLESYDTPKEEIDACTFVKIKAVECLVCRTSVELTGDNENDCVCPACGYTDKNINLYRRAAYNVTEEEVI